MKCWTKYVLPLVIAMCMFLGSSFYSSAAEPEETDAVQGVTPEGLGYEACFLVCKDEVQAVLDGRDYNFDDFYYYGYYDAALDQIKVYLTQHKLVCVSCSDTYFVAQERYLVMYTAVVTRDSKLLSCQYNYYTMNTNINFPLNSTSFSNYDIYDAAGDLFFSGAVALPTSSPGPGLDDGDDGDSDDTSLIDSILNIPNRIAQSLKVHFESITSGITNFKEDVSSWFANLGINIREGLDNVWTRINGALGDQLQKLADVWLEINTLPLRIQEKVRELFEDFFVPDEELTNQRLKQIREQFAFVESISEYGETLINFFKSASGASAPVIQVNLGDYAGSFNYGSGTVVIDFSWYAPYKPTVDNIVAGIIWATWLWHMYKRIPDIIAGNSMTTASALKAARKDDD